MREEPGTWTANKAKWATQKSGLVFIMAIGMQINMLEWSTMQMTIYSDWSMPERLFEIDTTTLLSTETGKRQRTSVEQLKKLKLWWISHRTQWPQMEEPKLVRAEFFFPMCLETKIRETLHGTGSGNGPKLHETLACTTVCGRNFSKIPTKVGCHIWVSGIKAGSQVSSCHLEQYRED